GVVVVSRRSARGGVEVAEEAHFGAVVDDLAADVEDERGHGGVCPGALGGSDRGGQALGVEAAHALDPAGVGAVELGEARGGVAGGAVGGVVVRWSAEVGVPACAQDPDDDVADPPRNGGQRCGGGFGLGGVDGEVASSGLHLGVACAPWPHVPGQFVGGRGVVVFLVGQALKSRAEVAVPV